MEEYGESAYHFEGDFIKVVIPFDKKGFSFESQSIDREGKLSKTQEAILGLLRIEPNATVQLMMAEFSMSDYGVRKNLKVLEEKGYIIRIGSRKTGYWKILKQ